MSFFAFQNTFMLCFQFNQIQITCFMQCWKYLIMLILSAIALINSNIVLFASTKCPKRTFYVNNWQELRMQNRLHVSKLSFFFVCLTIRLRTYLAQKTLNSHSLTALSLSNFSLNISQAFWSIQNAIHFLHLRRNQRRISHSCSLSWRQLTKKSCRIKPAILLRNRTKECYCLTFTASSCLIYRIVGGSVPGIYFSYYIIQNILSFSSRSNFSLSSKFIYTFYSRLRFLYKSIVESFNR